VVEVKLASGRAGVVVPSGSGSQVTEARLSACAGEPCVAMVAVTNKVVTTNARIEPRNLMARNVHAMTGFAQSASGYFQTGSGTP
jgi:hypothetical protein